MSGRSAIVEPGDGEMTVPPVLQPVLDIFSPLVNLQNPPLLSQDTWIDFNQHTAVGAQLVQVTNFTTLAAGRWDIQLIHAFNFIGSTSAGNSGSVSLNDPGSGVETITNFNFVNFNQNVITVFLPFLFTRPGWFFTHTTSPTVIGDMCTNTLTIYARRIF